MGFWSGLAKVGAGIAAPFTGGASAALIPAIGAIAGKAAKGSADQRVTENTQAQNAYGNQLQAARFNQGERDAAMKRQLLMTLLGGSLSPLNVTPGNPAIASKMGAMSGGYGSLNRDALMQALGQVQSMSAPGVPKMQGAGMGEKILGGAGLALSLLGALNKKPEDGEDQ